MANIGSWGKKLVFEVNSKKKLSPTSFQRSSSSRWSDHEIIGKKAKSEFLGPGMEQIQLEIILDVSLGIKPRKMLESLENANDKGEVNNLIINNKKIGSNKWAIDSISEDWQICGANGELTKAKLSLTLREYR